MQGNVMVERAMVGGGLAAVAEGMKPFMRTVVYKVAALVSAEAKRFSPIDTGRLRASIHIEPVDELSYQVITNVYYGIYQEFGTSKMKAHPYMRPAAAVARAQLPGMVKSAKVI